MFKNFFKNKESKSTEPSQHPTDFDALIEKAVNQTEALQSAHTEITGIGHEERFDVDFEQNTIAWRGKERLISADANLIGTWSGQTETFLWGWDHPISPPANSCAAQQVKDYADKYKIDLLQDRKLVSKLDDAWKLAALAVLLGDLQGVYRAPAGEDSYAFVGYDNIKITSA